MNPLLQFIKIDSQWYLQKEPQEDDTLPFNDICFYKGHLFLDNESIEFSPSDIERKCFVCENIVTFYHYSKEAIRKELLSLDRLPN